MVTEEEKQNQRKADEELLKQLLESKNGKSLRAPYNKIIALFKNEKHINTVLIVTETLQIMRNFVGSKRFKDPDEMISIVKALGRRLIYERSSEFVIKNAIRRVLFLINEETKALKTDAKKIDLRPMVIEAINELLIEVENLIEPISRQALDHINGGDNLLTCGYSNTVLRYLLFAKKHKRNFTVFVLENSPDTESGHRMANELGKNGISSILLPDSACHAMMPKVDKVLISPNCVLATGAVIAPSGSNLVSFSARFHRKPFICVAGLHKLTPEVDGRSATILGNSFDVAPDLDLSDIPIGRQVKLVYNRFDIIEPERISLLVTNTGAHQTSYIHRLLAEYYDQDDFI